MALVPKDFGWGPAMAGPAVDFDPLFPVPKEWPVSVQGNGILPPVLGTTCPGRSVVVSRVVRRSAAVRILWRTAIVRIRPAVIL